MRRSHIDLAPTIADLMGSWRTRVPRPELGPRDLRRQGAGAPHHRRSAALGSDGSATRRDRRRHQDHRLRRRPPFKVYDLEKDPWEKTDLAKTDPAELERMKRIYLEESAKIPVVEVVGGAPLRGAPAGQRARAIP